MNWNINDTFKISCIEQLETHCPRVHTYGTILEFLSNNKARVILDKVEDEQNVEAIVKIRDIRPDVRKKG